jgi:type IV fimbrial biogenesis protein FimT
MLTSGPRVQRGFTLVELLIGIVILGILITLAMPSFSAWIQNTQIRNAADALANGLQLARAQAIARNVQVQFQVQGTNGWQVTEVAAGTQIQSWTAQEGAQNTTVNALPNGATTITYNPMGRVIPNPDGTASLATLDVTANTAVTSATRALRVAIGAGGGTRMCDPNLTDPTDPRAC